MKRWRILSGIAIGLLVQALTAFAQDTNPNVRKPPLEMASYDWQKDARNSKLTDAQIATLRTQGFVVTGNTCRQSFFAYLDGEQLFVTSDCIANTYSVLLEDSVRLLETTNARRLNTFLVEAWKEVPALKQRFTGDPALLNPALIRASMMLGVALELSTGAKVDAPRVLQEAIDDEAQRVIAATGTSKPSWLGPPDPGFLAIDYTRFKPRGLYVGRPALERYFRATSWLQAIPFRVGKDEELAAWLLLFQGLNDYQNKPLYNARQEISDPGARGSASSMMGAMVMLVGLSDDADIFDGDPTNIPDNQWNSQKIAEVRQDLAKSGPFGDGAAHLSQINDQIAVAGEDAKPELKFRMLSAYRLPDAAMFTDTEKFRPGFPSGLEIAAALGSPTARLFYTAGNAKLLAQIDKDKGAFAKGTVYNDYLNALATLFEPVDASAPDLFRTPAWQEKSLQTFLGGWAQDRHAWLLQAKQNELVMGMGEVVPSGFVEPVPDFFNRMAQLALKSHQIFHEAGAFDNGVHDAVQELRDAAAAYRRWLAAKGKAPNAKPSDSDMEVMEGAQEFLLRADYARFTAVTATDNDAPGELEKYADRLENSGSNLSSDERQALSFSGYLPEEKWTKFASICLKLEELANKQLHHQPLTDEDNRFYQDFGSTLASAMGYDSNYFEGVHDDAPRIADIYSDPMTGQVMEVGIGRPLRMYVLYPYERKSILTHGAVLPYYEFSSGERLTDQSWANLLTTPAAPAPPDWLKNVTSKPIPATKSAGH